MSKSPLFIPKKMVRYINPENFMSIDDSHYRLILKLGKEMQINHHS
jgi:hypothetical protein